MQDGQISINGSFAELFRQSGICFGIISAVAFKIKVRHATMPFKRRNIKITFTLRFSYGVFFRGGFFQCSQKSTCCSRIFNRWIQVGHHAPVTITIFHFSPADVDVHRWCERVRGVNDGRNGAGRAQFFACVIIVMNL